MKWLKGYKPPLMPPGCNDCSDTVTFEGLCVNKHELNYLMYGLATAASREDLLGTSGTLYTLRLGLLTRGNDTPEMIDRKINAAWYGYKLGGGWTGPPGAAKSFKWSSSKADCKPSGNPAPAYTDPDNWFWTGLRSLTQ
jgi:hypothetical protein